jgi:toxin-antitoxin system PIN domain toxin
MSKSTSYARTIFIDVNVLIALFDGDHVAHKTAAKWLEAHAPLGWASCPITQNGCIRIMSHAGYPSSLPIQAIADRLAEACAHQLHEFWHDDISLTDTQHFDTSRLHGPRQLRDVYLLALAAKNGGRFVTFDRAVPLEAAIGASRKHLLVI